MGVWRDPSCVRSHELKKRARFEHGRWKKRMRIWQLALPKKSALHLDDRPANGCILTTGRLMGVTVIRPNSRHDEKDANAHLVAGAVIGINARKNEQSYQAAHCVSFYPSHFVTPSRAVH